MKQKKLVLIFGGAVGLYTGFFRVFDKIEKEFNCSLRRITPYKVIGEIDNIIIESFFCLNPIRDNNYLDAKRFHETKYKDVISKPASEIVKDIKSPDAVLFFGLCGSFTGRKNEIYVPSEIGEIIFKEGYVKKKEIDQVKVMNKIKIKNILNKVGKETRGVTSNLTLTYTCMENHCQEDLINLANVLTKEGDFVDKESYQIAKCFRKIPLGILVMTSDVLSIKKHMFDEKSFNPDKERFNNKVIESIKIGLNKI